MASAMRSAFPRLEINSGTIMGAIRCTCLTRLPFAGLQSAPREACALAVRSAVTARSGKKRSATCTTITASSAGMPMAESGRSRALIPESRSDEEVMLVARPMARIRSVKRASTVTAAMTPAPVICRKRHSRAHRQGWLRV